MSKIIIIGAGIAGLSAGIYARGNRYDATVYELLSVFLRCERNQAALQEGETVLLVCTDNRQKPPPPWRQGRGHSERDSALEEIREHERSQRRWLIWCGA